MAQTLQPPSLQCPAPVLRAGGQGIARVAVDDATARLTVAFLAPITPAQTAYLFDPASYSLTGGVRIFPRILSAVTDPQGVRLQLDQIGDFSIYTLTVNGPDIDPFFGSSKLRFRLSCDDRFDCRPGPAPEIEQPEIPIQIDYLAKDYAGFRQALLDFIPTRLPSWTERSEADIGMTLLELFASTADNLSYVQDRVANEAFLATATQRRSVAGHLALIGYQMDEGASARTYLQFQVNAVHTLGGTTGLKVSNRRQSTSEAVIVFETEGELTLDPKHNSINLHDFGNKNCCIPPGATNAALSGSFDGLNAGDYLLFDNGSGERDIVRLTSEPQMAGAFTQVTWSVETPLNHSYCTANSVVRGNVMPATHGETVSEQLVLTDRGKRKQARLSQAPLAHLDTRESLDGTDFTDRPARSASTLSITVDNTPYRQRTSLMGAGASDAVFRVEVGDDGSATVVFGDGTFGRRPPDDAVVIATYRVGGGSRGNIGAGTLVQAHPASPAVWLDSVTNPLPATGGRDLESRDHARRNAPATFQTPLVAVTAADYQDAATALRGPDGRPAIQRANASFRWTGSWVTVTLAVDPMGAEGVTPELRRGLMRELDAKRLSGYDIEITAPAYVPIELSIEFSTRAGFQQADVQQALLLALGSGRFFHPDNFTFGDPVIVSRLFAVMAAVAGVQNVRITRLARLHAAQPARETAVNLAQGYLTVGHDEIIRLDNDRNSPQNGTLSIQPMRGQS